MELFGAYIQGLATTLELHKQRHRVITENIANVETPGYRARELEFKSALADAFDPQRASAFSKTDAEPRPDPQAVVKLDGNSVDIDTEMARLADNTFKIRLFSRFLSGAFGGMKRAIEGGNR